MVAGGDLLHLESGEFKATSADLILNGGLYREQYQDGLKLGIEITLNS